MRSRVPTIFAAIAASIVVISPAAAQVPAGDTSAKSIRDSAPRPAADTARSRSAQTQVVSADADTVLAQACGPSGRGSADGLLVVTFDPTSVPAARVAAAKQAGGALVPRPGGLDGEYYIRLAGGGSEPQLQGLADQLILLPSVRAVGSARCPRVQAPPQPPSQSQPQPRVQAPPSDSGQAQNPPPGR